MLVSRFVVSISGLMMVLPASIGFSQSYPSKAIRIVNTGGSTDVVARLIAPALAANMGQPVIVDNRTDVIAREIVVKASPDGYTVHVTGSGLWVEPLLRKIPYDPMKDYSPITLATSSPNVLVVHPSVAAKSVKDLIALAKAKPRELNFASGGTGGAAHIAVETFKGMAGIDMVHVAYKNTAQGVIALISGEVQLMITSAQAVAPHVRSGKLRALAVGSAKPSALVPDLPTMAAAGVPGFESSSNQSFLAPAKTPAVIINRLHQEIVRVISAPEMRDPLLNVGLEVVASTPDQLKGNIEAEMERMRKVIKDVGIRLE